MHNLKALIAAAFESAPAANFRDVNFDALLQELHSSANQRHTSELGIFVLALVTSHIKSGVLAEKAVTAARGR